MGRESCLPNQFTDRAEFLTLLARIGWQAKACPTSAACRLFPLAVHQDRPYFNAYAWSTRVPLDPHAEQRDQPLAVWKQADGGVGRGPGGPPHDSCRCPVSGKPSDIGRR